MAADAMTPERARKRLTAMKQGRWINPDTVPALALALAALDAVARVRAVLDRDTIACRIAVNGMDAYRAEILRALDGEAAR